MPQATANPIRSVRRYECGYCENQLAFVFRGHPLKRRRFPSNVFLIEHSSAGYILFDTGYSTDIYRCGWRGRLYTAFNPTVIQSAEQISVQLSADGIDPDSIRYIVVSHLHPDHIGGLKFFPKATIIMSQATLDTFHHPSARDLVFPKLFPAWFDQNVQVLDQGQLTSSGDGQVRGYDLLGDHSLLITSLAGHTEGQLGVYLPQRLLLAADACWGQDLMSHAHRMRSVVRRVNYDYHTYRQRLNELEALQQRGVKLYFSHDTIHDKELWP